MTAITKTFEINQDFKKLSSIGMSEFLKAKLEHTVIVTDNTTGEAKTYVMKECKYSRVTLHEVDNDRFYTFPSTIKEDDNLTAVLNFKIKHSYEDNINMIDADGREFKEYPYGKYLILYLNMDLLKITFDIMDIRKNLNVIANCFEFDIKGRYVVLSYALLTQ